MAAMMQLKFISLLVGVSVLICFTDSFAEDRNCPFPGMYIEIDRSYHECANGYVKEGANCDLFLEKIEKLFPRYNCKRSYDTAPVPAIWLFGAASEDYIKLLYELAAGVNKPFNNKLFEKQRVRAKEIFLSPNFRSVLEGYLAEEYFPLIEKIKGKEH